MHVNPKYSFENAAPPNLSTSDSKSTTGGRKIRKNVSRHREGGGISSPRGRYANQLVHKVMATTVPKFTSRYKYRVPDELAP